MNPIARAVAALALALGATPALAPPASAADTAGNFSFKDGVLYSGCFDVNYNFYLDLPEGTTDWSLDVSIQTPDGTEIGSDYVYGTGRIGTLSSSTFLCGAEDAGLLTALGTVEGYGDEVSDYTMSMSPQFFVMRRPYSQTTTQLLNAPKCGKTVKVAITTKDERPNGYFPADYADIALQQLRNGTWTTVASTETYTEDDTTGTGVASIRWKANRKGKCKPLTLRGTSLFEADYRDASYGPAIPLR